MIVGLGTDLALIARFLDLKLKDKIVGEEDKADSASSLAKLWAAKEAFAKALGTGFVGFTMKDLTLCHDDLGKPYFKYFTNLTTIMLERFKYSLPVCHVSISKESHYVTATVILEKKEQFTTINNV